MPDLLIDIVIVPDQDMINVKNTPHAKSSLLHPFRNKEMDLLPYPINLDPFLTEFCSFIQKNFENG